MKALKLFFALSLITIFTSSYRLPDIEEKLIPYLTMQSPDGVEETKSFNDLTLADWDNEMSIAEFRIGDKAVEGQGIIVYVPKGGDARVIWFSDNKGFTTGMKKIATDHKFSSGDRFILDNLKVVDTKKTYSPIVVTLK